MNDFKKASTLHDDYGKKPKANKPQTPATQPRTPKTRKCEHHKNGVCEASREALRLGLRKNVITCDGNIPPSCVIQQALKEGKTVMEIYRK